MANRRSLHKKISVSVQLSYIREFAQLLFTWLIPHLDDFGRIHGNSARIKALVVPMSKRTDEEVEEALEEMKDVGLIQRYKYEDKDVIFFTNFDSHQIGLTKRTKSKYPDPEGNFSEIQRNTSLTEKKRTEENFDWEKSLSDFIPANKDEETAKRICEEVADDPSQSFPTLLKLVKQGLKAEDMENFLDYALIADLENPIGYIVSKGKKLLGIKEIE